MASVRIPALRRISRLHRLEFVFGQVVSSAHGACHFRYCFRARSASISLFERSELPGQRAIAEHLPNPTREIAAHDVPRQQSWWRLLQLGHELPERTKPVDGLSDRFEG